MATHLALQKRATLHSLLLVGYALYVVRHVHPKGNALDPFRFSSVAQPPLRTEQMHGNASSVAEACDASPATALRQAHNHPSERSMGLATHLALQKRATLHSLLLVGYALYVVRHVHPKGNALDPFWGTNCVSIRRCLAHISAKMYDKGVLRGGLTSVLP